MGLKRKIQKIYQTFLSIIKIVYFPIAQLAKNAVAIVIALSQRDFYLNIALANGADHILKLDDYLKIIEKVKEL